MNSFQLLRSQMLALSQPTKWSNVIPVTESTCHAVCYTEEMLCQKMSMLPLPPLRPRDQSNLLIGAQPDSRSEPTTNRCSWWRLSQGSTCRLHALKHNRHS